MNQIDKITIITIVLSSLLNTSTTDQYNDYILKIICSIVGTADPYEYLISLYNYQTYGIVLLFSIFSMMILCTCSYELCNSILTTYRFQKKPLLN